MKKQTLVRWELGVLGILVVLVVGRILWMSVDIEEDLAVEAPYEYSDRPIVAEEELRLDELEAMQLKIEEAARRAEERASEFEALAEERASVIEERMEEAAAVLEEAIANRAEAAGEAGQAPAALSPPPTPAEPLNVPAPPTGATLVSQIGLGNDMDVQQNFSLNAETVVQIYAVGEMTVSGRRYDYGWIEDAQGNTVWEMKWENTQPAGGHTTHRVFAGSLELASGNYAAHFKTDATNSSAKFDNVPPQYQGQWGILIVR